MMFAASITFGSKTSGLAFGGPRLQQGDPKSFFSDPFYFPQIFEMCNGSFYYIFTQFALAAQKKHFKPQTMWHNKPRT